MRKYEAAWIQLRDRPNEPLKIAAHPAMHQRIFKAVVKEKDSDLVFKFLMKEDGKFSKLTRKSNGGQLVITIKFYLGLSDL